MSARSPRLESVASASRRRFSPNYFANRPQLGSQPLTFDFQLSTVNFP
jgi:hypothetical protein